ncbi:MAG TPA: PEP-CTERM/exosortase system-associated acyltransferase [Casimicrobiaceae bacterium]|nr:PEP-CTERM/exosortase system-associated acyltransferase [Casimicrobiaceae bacterium]
MSFYAEATGASSTSLGLGMLSSLDVGRAYREFFALVHATSDDHRNEAYAIRHAVYCAELGFESPRSEGLERDSFDARAEHLLLGSVAQSRFVACARLILAAGGADEEPFPIETLCGPTLGARWSNLRRGHRVAELSRVAVVADFRRRKGEELRDFTLGEADFGTVSRPRFPYIPVALCLGAVALARRIDVDTIVVLTEAKIATHLARLGIHLTQIGGPVHHHGTRVPAMLSVGDVIASMRSFMAPLYRAIESDLDSPRHDSQTG